MCILEANDIKYFTQFPPKRCTNQPYPAPVLDADASTSGGQVPLEGDGPPDVGQRGSQDNATASTLHEVTADRGTEFGK